MEGNWTETDDSEAYNGWDCTDFSRQRTPHTIQVDLSFLSASRYVCFLRALLFKYSLFPVSLERSLLF